MVGGGKKIRVRVSAYWGNGGDARSSLTIPYADDLDNLFEVFV
jgi:hypothetical protein